MSFKNTTEFFNTYPHLKGHIPDNSIVIDTSFKKSYTNQRKADVKPLSTCGVSSFAAAIKIANIRVNLNDRLNVNKRTKLPDYIYDVIQNDEEIDTIYNNVYKQYGYPKEQIHKLLAMGAAKACHHNTISRFSTETKLTDIVWSLLNGKPVIISGVFSDYKYNHISPVVGVVTTQQNILNIVTPNKINTEAIIGFIIDDTFGDGTENYRNKNTYNDGDNTFYPSIEFNHTVKPVDRSDVFWAHILCNDVVHITSPVDLFPKDI